MATEKVMLGSSGVEISTQSYDLLNEPRAGACPECQGEEMRASEWNPAEAIYAFAGYLTGRPDQVVGRESNAAPMAEQVAAFIARHRLPEPRRGWENAIIPER